MTNTTDTIAAIATPPGRGGICIVRVSGPDAAAIGEAIAGALPSPRQAAFRKFKDHRGDTLDEGIVLLFPGPASFTGEDVVEFHGHGGSVIADLLMERILQLGAVPAAPGEFSQRAFLNDRIDLVQAEAIADLIDSGSAAAARAAVRSLTGEFSGRVRALVEALTDLRVYVEASIDFPEEEVDFLADRALEARIADLFGQFETLQGAVRQGAILRNGMTIVLAGKPNVGKSSLMNRLTGEDTAIVTHIPGTTRDVLRREIAIDGLPLHVIDTAGLRRGAGLVEEEGIRRARREMETADRVLLVTDSEDSDADQTALAKDIPAGVPVTIVRNKIDLAGDPSGERQTRRGMTMISVSALTGDGVDLLRDHLERCIGFQAGESGALSARRRHLDALARARRHLDLGRKQLELHKAGELMAEELRLAQQALGEITGEVTSEDLLGRIFASFCIGK